MASGRAPLATLLIISAIDLLVCCLTAGVMLFLIFQPSQRTDRSTTVQSRASAAVKAKLRQVDADAAPIIVIVRNDGPGELKVEALASAGYRTPSATSDADGSVPAGRQMVLVSKGPGRLITFASKSAPSHAQPAPFKARISVVRSGVIQSQEAACTNEGGGRVIVNPSATSVVRVDCDTAIQCEPTYELECLQHNPFENTLQKMTTLTLTARGLGEFAEMCQDDNPRRIEQYENILYFCYCGASIKRYSRCFDPR